MADTEEDLFKTEDISAESEKSEDSLFESEEILEEEKNAGTGLGESQPINGQNGAIGTMMGVMPEAEKESTIPRGSDNPGRCHCRNCDPWVYHLLFLLLLTV